MSFPCTLDEISSEELVRELSNRHYRRVSALICPYCEKPLVDKEGKEVRHLAWKEQVATPIVNCICRFGEVDKYHSPYVLKSLQYGD